MSPASNPQFKNKAGFTLIELLIVIALIAILAAITAPIFSTYRDNANLKEAVREISGDIQLYKQRAVAENTRYRMAFDVDNNDYTIQRETNGVWNNVISDKQIGAGHEDTIKINGNTTFTNDTIIFQTRGTTSAGALEIRHEKRLSEAEIETNLMGRVRVTYDLK